MWKVILIFCFQTTELKRLQLKINKKKKKITFRSRRKNFMCGKQGKEKKNKRKEREEKMIVLAIIDLHFRHDPPWKNNDDAKIPTTSKKLILKVVWGLMYRSKCEATFHSLVCVLHTLTFFSSSLFTLVPKSIITSQLSYDFHSTLT